MTQQGAGGEVVVQAGEVRSVRIESLRALAAMAVLVGHVFGQARGYDPARTLATLGDRIIFGGGFGAYLFFALSGYLLYLPFARRALAGGREIDLAQYARNRALRILPLYYVALVVVLLVAESGGSLHQWLTFATFTENFTHSRDDITAVNGVVWTLVIEVYFYLLLPLIAYVVARLARGSVARAGIVLGLAGIVSLAVRAATFYRAGHILNPLLDDSIVSTFFFFVAGMLVALLRIAWAAGRPAWVRGPIAHTDAWIAASAVLWLVLLDNYSRGYLAAPASFLLLGACVLPLRQGLVVRGLEWPVLAAVGIASYSLYIWQLPLLEAMSHLSIEPSAFLPYLAVAGPLAIAVAFLSYRVVEEPFLRLRRRWGTTVAGPGAG
nr:acyltransferase [uncultured bacterium]